MSPKLHRRQSSRWHVTDLETPLSATGGSSHCSQVMHNGAWLRQVYSTDAKRNTHAGYKLATECAVKSSTFKFAKWNEHNLRVSTLFWYSVLELNSVSRSNFSQTWIKILRSGNNFQSVWPSVCLSLQSRYLPSLSVHFCQRTRDKTNWNSGTSTSGPIHLRCEVNFRTLFGLLAGNCQIFRSLSTPIRQTTNTPPPTEKNPRSHADHLRFHWHINRSVQTSTSCTDCKRKPVARPDVKFGPFCPQQKQIFKQACLCVATSGTSLWGQNLPGIQSESCGCKTKNCDPNFTLQQKKKRLESCRNRAEPGASIFHLFFPKQFANGFRSDQV